MSIPYMYEPTWDDIILISKQTWEGYNINTGHGSTQYRNETEKYQFMTLSFLTVEHQICQQLFCWLFYQSLSILVVQLSKTESLSNACNQIQIDVGSWPGRRRCIYTCELLKETIQWLHRSFQKICCLRQESGCTFLRNTIKSSKRRWRVDCTQENKVDDKVLSINPI